MFIWATLIPDLISIVYLDGVCQFIIFDAKYYNLQLEHDKKLRGQPGIESITEHSIYKKSRQHLPASYFALPALLGGHFFTCFRTALRSRSGGIGRRRAPLFQSPRGLRGPAARRECRKVPAGTDFPAQACPRGRGSTAQPCRLTKRRSDQTAHGSSRSSRAPLPVRPASQSARQNSRIRRFPAASPMCFSSIHQETPHAAAPEFLHSGRAAPLSVRRRDSRGGNPPEHLPFAPHGQTPCSLSDTQRNLLPHSPQSCAG